MRRRQVLRDTAALTMAQVVANAASFAIGWSLARALGEEAYGIFAAAYAGAQAIGAIADAGVRMALIRETARTPDAWRGLLLRAWVASSAFGLAALVVAAGIVVWREGIEAQVLRAGLVAHVFFWSLLRITLGVAAGHGRLVAVAQWMAGERTGIAVLVTVLAWGAHASLQTIAWAMAAVEAVALVGAVRWTLGFAGGRKPAMGWRAFLRRALPFGIGGALQGWISRADLIVLGFSAHPAQTGRYAAAQTLAGMLLLVATSLGSASFPRFSAMHAQAEMARAKAAAMDASRALFAVVLVAGSIVAALAEWLLPFVYGAGYAAGAHRLAWFALWIVWPALGAVVGALGSAWGFQGWWARLLLAAAPIAPLGFWLAAKLGVDAVAVTTGVLQWALVAGYWMRLAKAGLVDRAWLVRATIAGWALWALGAGLDEGRILLPVLAVALLIALRIVTRKELAAFVASKGKA